jgi:hypothetical protein
MIRTSPFSHQPFDRLDRQPFTLQQGQMFFGKVNKLFSNGTAEVVVGKERFVAKLETPLEVAGKYLFQVQMKDGQVVLKVMSSNQPITSHHQLLTSLSLPYLPIYETLLAWMEKEHIQLSKANLLQLAQWLADVEDQSQALNVLKQMLQRGLPLEKDVFFSYLAGTKGDSLTHEINQFLKELHHWNGNTTLKQSLLTTGQFIQNGWTRILAQQVWALMFRDGVDGKNASITEWFLTSGDVPKDETWLGLAEKNIRINVTKTEDGKLSFVQLLQKFIPLAKATDPTIGDELFKQLILLEKGDVSSAHVSILAKTLVNAMVHVIQQSPLEITKQPMSQLFQHLFNISPGKIEQLIQHIQAMVQNDSLGENIIPKEMETYIQKIIESSSHPVHWQGRVWKELFGQIMKHLGLGYEGAIGKGEQPLWTEQLKPLLVQLLQEPVPTQLKEQAEHLLMKLNAPAVTQQQMGPLTQVVFQLPLNLFNYETDITFQWTGRKKENGEIDPHFCRVLFYLDLAHLHETIVDMHVQNKIVSITIFQRNETIEQLAQPYLSSLKERLLEKGYRLSTVQFKPLQQKSNLQPSVNTSEETTLYTGVDIRI